MAVVLLATILAVLPVLILISNSARHMADVVPSLMILAAIGFWQGLLLAPNRWLRRLWVCLAWILAIATVILGWLLAITGYEARFEVYNPELFERMTRLLTW